MNYEQRQQSLQEQQEFLAYKHWEVGLLIGLFEDPEMLEVLAQQAGEIQQQMATIAQQRNYIEQAVNQQQ